MVEMLSALNLNISQEPVWQAQHIYFVNIKINKANNLKISDANNQSKIHVNVQCGERIFETKSIENDSNPIFNDHVQFKFYRQPQQIMFNVYDNDTNIGNYTLDINDFFDTIECVQLNDTDSGTLDINVKCSMLAPFEMMDNLLNLADEKDENEEKMEEIEEQIGRLKANKLNLINEIPSYESSIEQVIKQIEAEKSKYNEVRTKVTQYEAEYKSLREQCDSLKTEYKNLRKEYKQMNEESEDSESARYELMERIERYVHSMQDKEENDENKKFDDSLYKSLIIRYKEKRKNAQKYEEKSDEYEAKKERACSYLLEIQKWKNDCNEAVQMKKEQFMNEYDENEFWHIMFVDLNKYFYNLYVVGATLDVFGDEIKKKTKKSIKKVTFGDFYGDDGIWNDIYWDLDFVMDELSKIYNNVWMDKRMQIIFKKVKEFFNTYKGGDYVQFCRLICHYLPQIVIDNEEISAISTNDFEKDAMESLILIMADKYSFCLNLYESMKQNVNKFEQVLAEIVVAVCQIDSMLESVDEDIVSAKEEKIINDRLKAVLERCVEIDVDEKAQSEIKKFFAYFFKPEYGEFCACDGNVGGISGLFGKIFGGICSR